MTRETLIEQLAEGAYILEPSYFDDAIIGVDEEGRVAYSYEELIMVLTTNGLTNDEAVDYIDFNIFGSLPNWGELRPTIIHKVF